MKNIRVKAFVSVLLVVSVSLWVAVLWISGIELKLDWPAFKKLPQVITLDMMLWFVFAKWAWKWKVFQGWLVTFPVLQGTWQGVLTSTWKNPETGQAAGKIPMLLVIKQTFMTISCTIHTHTQESSSYSYAAAFLLDAENGLKQLVYTYTNKPKVSVRHRSAVHDGTALLTIISKPDRILKGEYWTNRRTTGELELRFRSEELLETLPDDFKPQSKETDVHT